MSDAQCLAVIIVCRHVSAFFLNAVIFVILCFFLTICAQNHVNHDKLNLELDQREVENLENFLKYYLSSVAARFVD